MKTSLAIFVTLTLLISIFGVSMSIHPTHAQETNVRIVPATQEFGPSNVTGTEFSIAAVVEDVTSLAGFDIRFSWDTTYLEYVNHTFTVPVQDHPTPISPSPYAGILEAETFTLKDVANTTDGTYWGAAAHLGTTGFNGSGTVAVMTFRIIDQPTAGEEDATLTFHFTNDELADSNVQPISHTTTDGTVTLRAPAFTYPAWPLLKITPEDISNVRLNDSFTIDVYLMGDGQTNLDPFWDVAGIDVTVNFNATLVKATGIEIDPDAWFAGFWPQIWVIANETDNVAGTVHLCFVGYGASHTSPSGQGKLFSVAFTAIYEAEDPPAPLGAITLENPMTYTGGYGFDSLGGLIDTSVPVGTDWHEIYPSFCNGPFELTTWIDDGDGKLGANDQVVLTDPATGFYFDYHITNITGTLNLIHLYTAAKETEIWVASFGPDNIDNNGLGGRYVGTDDPYDGFGVPNWTGNFTIEGLSDVDTITVHALPLTDDEYTYTLVEGVDYIVHAAEDKIELLTPVDVRIENELVGTMPVGSPGWPAISYVASAFENCYVVMPNGTSRNANNLGYAMEPPSEYWFDPDWSWELESWWATGYYPGDWVWPDGTEIYLNYTAASYLEIDYMTEPEGIPRFVDYAGTYDQFLTVLSAPNQTMWNEIYMKNWQDHQIVDWNDVNTNSLLDGGDVITTQMGTNLLTFQVNVTSTDISTLRKPWINEGDPADPFFGIAPIISLPSFPHPDRSLSPWHNHGYAVPLPHKVENALYTAPVTQQPPVAIFTITPATPYVAETVTFNATDSYDPDGEIAAYFWDFGDGANATGVIATHTYTNDGTYTVTLTVTDNTTITDTDSQQLYVRAPLVLALSPGTGFASTTVTGANFAPDSAITITWDGTVIPTVPQSLMTDNAGSFAAIISIPTQTAAGAHTIVATDGDGNTRQATFTVIAMTGPAGSPGAPGATGATGAAGSTGPQGPTGPSGAPELSYAAILLALIALILSVFMLLRKR